MIIAPVGLSKNFQYDCLINTLLTNKRENIFWYHHKTGSCSSVHQGWADNPYTGQTIDEPLQCAEEYCREWSKWDTDTVIDWCGCWCCSRVTCGRQFLHCHCFHWSTTTESWMGDDWDEGNSVVVKPRTWRSHCWWTSPVCKRRHSSCKVKPFICLQSLIYLCVLICAFYCLLMLLNLLYQYQWYNIALESA